MTTATQAETQDFFNQLIDGRPPHADSLGCDGAGCAECGWSGEAPIPGAHPAQSFTIKALRDMEEPARAAYAKTYAVEGAAILVSRRADAA